MHTLKLGRFCKDINYINFILEQEIEPNGMARIYFIQNLDMRKSNEPQQKPKKYLLICATLLTEIKQ